MSSILSYALGVIVFVLFATLIGPGLVSWDNYRPAVEAELSGFLGRDVRISGAIGFALLPAPEFSFEGIRIARARHDITGVPVSGTPAPDVQTSDMEGDGHTENPGDPFAVIGFLEGELALAPLLRGQIEVANIRIKDFALSLEQAPEGGENRIFPKDIFDPASESYIDPERIRLNRVFFEKGSVRYSSSPGVMPLAVDIDTGSFYAGSLNGPFRFNMQGVYEGRRLDLEWALGHFADSRAFPVTLEATLEATPDEPGGQLGFSGLSTGFSEDARLDGTLRFAAGRVQAASRPAVFPSVSTESGVVLDFEAAAVLRVDSARFRSVKLELPGVSLQGQGEADFSETSSLSLDLETASLTVGPMARSWTSMMQVHRLMETLLPDFAISASVDAAGVLYRDRTGRDLRFLLEREKGGWRIGEARLELGRQAVLEAQGRLRSDNGQYRFEGRADVQGPDVASFSGWLAGAGGSVPYGETVPFRFSAGFDIEDGTWRFPDLTLRLFETQETDKVRARAALTYASAQRTFVADIRVPGAINLTPFRPLVPDNAGTLGDLFQDERFRDLFRGSAQLSVAGREVRYGEWLFSGLDLQVSVEEETLAIERFAFSDLDGFSLEAGAAVVDIFGQPVVDARGLLKGKGLDKTLARLGLPLPSREWGESELSVSIRSDIGKEGHRITLDAGGQLDTSSIQVRAQRRLLQTGRAGTNQKENATRAEYDLSLTMENAEGPRLFSLWGARPAASVTGPGAIHLRLDGPLPGPMNVYIRGNASKVNAVIKGELAALRLDVVPDFSVRVDLSAPRFDALADTLGLQGGLTDFIRGNADSDGFIAGGQFDYKEGLVKLARLEAAAGTFRLSGAGKWDRRSPERTVITGELDFSRLQLDPLFQTKKQKTRDDIWPTRSLDGLDLEGIEGTFTVSADTLELAGIRISKVRAQAGVENAAVSLVPFSARLADGLLNLEAHWRMGAQKPEAVLTLKLEDADAARFGADLFSGDALTGRLDASLALEGQGRSWLALVSSLKGKGSVRAQQGVVRAFNLPALEEGLGALKTLEAFPALERQTLSGNTGSGTGTPYERIGGEIEVKNGEMSIPALAFAFVQRPYGRGRALIDLVKMQADIEFSLPLLQPFVPVDMVVTGPLRALERRADTLALQKLMADRLLSAQIDRSGLSLSVEDLQKLMESPSGVVPENRGIQRYKERPARLPQPAPGAEGVR